jgi:hypothetical protein
VVSTRLAPNRSQTFRASAQTGSKSAAAHNPQPRTVLSAGLRIERKRPSMSLADNRRAVDPLHPFAIF